MKARLSEMIDKHKQDLLDQYEDAAFALLMDEYAEKEGYKCTDALFEVYVTDPTTVESESELITEVYYPIKKMVKD